MQFEALLVHLGCCSLGYFPWKLVIFPPARWHAPIKYPWAMHSFTNILPPFQRAVNIPCGGGTGMAQVQP